MLANALKQAKPGDRILLASYGDGGDAFILTATESIGKIQQESPPQKKIYINYSQYLNWRDLLPIEQIRRPEPRTPSITCQWRERRSILALYGNRCRRCGTVQYPPQRICVNCQTKDDTDDYKLSDKKGKVFTYSIDYLSWSL